MSAHPQRIEPSRRVEPKLVKNEPGIYDSKTDEEVLELMYRSPWNVMALLPDIGRVCNGTAEETILLAIHLRSKGGPRGKGEKAPQYSPVLSVKTLAKMTRFSRQSVRQCVAAMTERGLILHLGEEGSDYWRMALDYDAIKAAPRAFVAREGAFTRKPVQSERVAADPEPVEEKGDRKAKAIEDKGTYDPPRATAIAPVSASPQPLPPKTATVVAQIEEHQIEIIHDLPCRVNYTTRTVTHGKHQIFLTSPGSLGEPPAGTRSQPDSSVLAGAGRVRQPVSAALNSNGAERVPGVSTATPSTARAAESLDLSRADELIEIFDPILKRHGCELLSKNAAALRAACDVVGNLDHGAIVLFAQKRAKRAINSVFHVALILKSCIESGSVNTGCPHCGAPKDRRNHLTGRCALCDGNRETATRMLKDGGFTDAEIAGIRGLR